MIKHITEGLIAIYDTEWTSWPGFMESGWKQPGRHCEIIQIGAVKLDAANNFAEIGTFEVFVKPRINPTLSEYITDLTGITQEEIDVQGRSFADALADFLAFLDDDLQSVFSFGQDSAIIRKNCVLNDIPYPDFFAKDQNLNEILTALNFIDDQSMSSELPNQLGLESSELSHNALGDARALATAIRHLRSTGCL